MNKKGAASWSYHHPVKVVGCQLAGFIKQIDEQENVLLVTSQGFTRRGLTAQIKNSIKCKSLHVYDEVTPNPDIDDLDKAIARLRGKCFSMILAVGGGSVMDAAKGFSIGLGTDFAKPMNEILREGKAADFSGRIPVVAVPTTSGTGSEVTQYSTIWDLTNGLKYSLAGEHVFAVTAVLDPSLTLTLPESETINTGLDAISHALEALWNVNANAFSELFATESLNLALRSLPGAISSPQALEFRAGMQRASLFAGYAISITKTAISHAISYPLTARLDVPHGLACGLSLGAIIDLQLEQKLVAKEHEPLLAHIKKLIESFNISAKMKAYAGKEQILELVPEMFDPSRIKNFNMAADQKLVAEILDKSLS